VPDRIKGETPAPAPAMHRGPAGASEDLANCETRRSRVPVGRLILRVPNPRPPRGIDVHLGQGRRVREGPDVIGCAG